MITEEKQLSDKVVHIGRVTKVVKGGRIFKFTALVVVGDHNGNVGIGHGKAREVPDAIRKAMDNAKKNMVSIPVAKGSIPHEIVGKFGASELVMKPAAPGTGIIAGGAVRSLFELAQLHLVLVSLLVVLFVHYLNLLVSTIYYANLLEAETHITLYMLL